MKALRLTLLFATLAALTSAAENVTIRQPVTIKGERSIVALKPGTVVELVQRGTDKVTIKFNDITAEIPASKLEAPPVAAAPAEKPAATPEKPAEKPAQSIPGKAVQKAKEVVKQKEKASAANPGTELVN